MNDFNFKILMLADGKSYHTERFLNEVRHQGCDVKLASLEKSPLVDYQLKKKSPISSLHYYLAVSELKKIINEYQPDIINAHFASGYGHLAARTESNIPIALNLWGSDILIVPKKSFLHKQKTTLALQKANLVFADSQYLLEQASRLNEIKNGHVIPWGIERKYIPLRKYIPSRKSIPLRENITLIKKEKLLTPTMKIISPRMHKEIYNHLFTIKALKNMIVSDQIELTLPSFGPNVEQFRQQADSITDGKIKYYNELSRSELLEKMSEHDIYLSSSKSDSSPVSLIEAMALGLLPVVGEIEGVKEWMDDESGFLFDLDNPQSLKNVIQQILKTEDTFEKILIKNHDKVLSKAVFEDNIKSHLMKMKEIIGADNDS